MKNTLFLCMVIDEISNKEVVSYFINAIDDYFARHQAATRFKNDLNYQPQLRRAIQDDWYVDACEV